MDTLSRRKSLLGLPGLLASLWLLDALASPLPARPKPPAEPPEPEPEPGPALGPLEAGAVYADSLPPRVLYSWTTEEQLIELRRDRRLLTRTESPTYGRTVFASAIEGRVAATGEPVAALLASARFARHRYAWTTAWATAVGCRGEAYGDRLLRIELRPEARMLVFAPGQAAEWRCVESDGRELPLEVALAQPDRIGVVFHLPAPVPGFGTFDAPSAGYEHNRWANPTFGRGSTLLFREYVLVNESMIAAFEIDTDNVRRELLRARRAAELASRLDRSRDRLRGIEAAWRTPAAELARIQGTPEALHALYQANLALVCAEYQPDRLPAVIAQLDIALGLLGEPLRHELPR